MATRELASAASARPFFRLDGVPVPMSHKLLRLIVPFGLLAFLSSSALLKATFYQFCAGLQLAFTAWPCVRVVRSRLWRPTGNCGTDVSWCSIAVVPFFDCFTRK
jgi:hypothetical protein